MLKLNIIEFFIVAGSVQGILFTSYLLLKSKKAYRKQNFSLAVFILIFSTVVLKGCYIGTEYYLIKPAFLFFPFYFTLGLGPLFYVYISFLLRKEYVFNGKQLLHLLPTFIQFCYYVTIFIKPQAERISYFQNEYFSKILAYEDLFGILSLGIYFYVSYRILKKYQQSVYNNVSDVRKNLFKWINNFIIAGYGELILWLIIACIDFFIYDYKQSYSFYYPNYLLIIVLLYWIIFKGFLSSSKIQPDFAYDNKSLSYIIPKKEIQLYLRKLKERMEKNKLYLNPKLSLQNLAAEIELNSKYLSQIINSELNKNFNDFVNEYRINMAKQELLSVKNNHYTISAISSKCGFNSKSSFNEVFKKHTLQTPSEFIKLNRS